MTASDFEVCAFTKNTKNLNISTPKHHFSSNKKNSFITYQGLRYSTNMFFQRRKLYNPVILSLELREKKFQLEKNKSIKAEKTEQNKSQTKKAKISKTKKGGNVLLISL